MSFSNVWKTKNPVLWRATMLPQACKKFPFQAEIKKKKEKKK
jgi:hypothetical protein